MIIIMASYWFEQQFSQKVGQSGQFVFQSGSVRRRQVMRGTTVHGNSVLVKK